MIENFENNPNNFDPQNNVKPLTRNQKLAVGSLILLAVFTVVLWGFQFGKSIKAPYDYAYTGEDEAETETAKCTGVYCSADGQSDLRFVDTDSDGLNDWEELNVYKTSPYLDDTDSDNVKDKAEVDSGNDPNCPSGKNCFGFSNVTNDTASTTGETSEVEDADTVPVKTNSTLDITGVGSVSGDTSGSSGMTEAEARKILSGEVDAKTLRKLLLDSGASQEMLSQISDEDLMASYKESISQ